MDIISYGTASKAASQEKTTRNDVLGLGVEGVFPHAKGRIDALENALQGVVEQSDKLIVNDAINIAKAHAKLNSVAKTMKYKMHNMVFDDLLDLSGIDTIKSNGYTHDAVNGWLTAGTGCVIETKEEVTDAVLNKVILTVETEPPLNIVDISKQATYTDYSIANIFDASKMTDGDLVNIAFRHSTNNREEGVIATFVTSKLFTKVIIYGHATYPLRGGKLFVDGQQVATTASQISKASPWTVDLPNIAGSIIQFRNSDYNYSSSMTEFQIFGGEPTVSEELIGTYFISRDTGTTWEPIIPDTLFYFKDSISPFDNKLRLKAELPSGVKLLNYSLTWA